MESPESFDEASELSYQNLLKDGAHVERQSILMDGQPALRIIFTDQRGACYDNVYFEKFKTRFSVLHQQRANPAYEKFLNSIHVYKEVKSKSKTTVPNTIPAAN